MKARPRKLNYPFDPSKVSDPKCWLTPEEGTGIQAAFTQGIRSITYAPRYPGGDRVWIIDEVEK